MKQYCPSERAIEVFGSGCFVNKSKMNMGVSFCYLLAVALICSWAVVLLTYLNCGKDSVMVHKCKLFVFKSFLYI